jgi:hypothetical protein
MPKIKFQSGQPCNNPMCALGEICGSCGRVKARGAVYEDKQEEKQYKTYEPSSGDLRKIKMDFAYHILSEGQKEKHALINEKAAEFCLLLVQLCPTSRDLSLALTNVKIASMMAVSAMAQEEE